jgi:hypothetical protein
VELAIKDYYTFLFANLDNKVWGAILEISLLNSLVLDKR